MLTTIAMHPVANKPQFESPDATERALAGVLIRCVVSGLITFICALMSLFCAMAFVPRRAEGFRTVPDVSWPVYYWLGHLPALVVPLIILALLYRRTRERVLTWAIAAFVFLLAHDVFLGHLLRRDYIGKF